jgi:hypothetical protein
LLANGQVLIAGGAASDSTALTSAELYVVETGEFAHTGGLLVARRNHTATLLENGTVLIAGGDGVTSAEIYRPSIGAFDSKTAILGAISSAALLKDGEVLLTGDVAQIYGPQGFQM